MKKLFLYVVLGLLWCSVSFAANIANCDSGIDETKLTGDATYSDGTPLERGHQVVSCEGVTMYWSTKQKKFLTDMEYRIENLCLDIYDEKTKKIKNSCSELNTIDTSGLTGVISVPRKELDFSKAIKIDFNSELIDLREYGDYSIQDEDDKYFLNILTHNLLDLNMISKKEFKKILKYKRKKSENIKGAKLFCSGDPNLIGDEDSEMIGFEFSGLSDFIGYGLGGDTWYDIKGNYKRTSKDIELSYSIIGTDKEDSFDIDRKTLKPGRSTQCAIINPSINMLQIFKNIQSNFIESSENKL